VGEPVRATVVFRGMVQGVGFRFTTRSIASGYAVSGYVENEPDGSVELVAEGQREEVEAFVEAVSRQMGRYIGERHIEWGSALGEFDGFSIRFAW